MKITLVVLMALAIAGCEAAASWKGRVYSSLEPTDEFIPIGEFDSDAKCQKAGRDLVDRMKLGRNGEASRRYAKGRTVCTRS